MEKSTPFSYRTADTLYNLVMSHMPRSLQAHPHASAAVLGAAGGYLMTRAVQRLGDVFGPELGMDTDSLRTMELLSAAAAVAAPFIHACRKSISLLNIVQEHPVYTTGVAAALAGGLTAIHVHGQEQQMQLEERV